jgi:1,4-dihydroxy-2-naphthoyl-CoA synthase
LAGFGDTLAKRIVMGPVMDEVLLTETRGAVRLLTLNRPAKLNALNIDLVCALTDALLAAQDDAAVAVAPGGHSAPVRTPLCLGP